VIGHPCLLYHGGTEKFYWQYLIAAAKHRNISKSNIHNYHVLLITVYIIILILMIGREKSLVVVAVDYQVKLLPYPGPLAMLAIWVSE